MLEGLKKGGKVKRKQPRKKPIKKARTKVVRRKKEKIFTQPAFEMFGYSRPRDYIPPAPQKPVGEEEYKKINELLQKAQEEKKEAEIKNKVVDEMRAHQIPSGMPAIMPDYERINQQLAVQQNKQDRLERGLQNVYKYGGDLAQQVKQQIAEKAENKQLKNKAGAPKKKDEEKQRSIELSKKADMFRKQKQKEKKRKILKAWEKTLSEDSFVEN
jgi:hypothetical protein